MKESKFKGLLFDADGVTITPKDPFSVQYATAHGLDSKTLASFFDERFDEAIKGKRDLKQLLEERRDLWQWKGSVEDLIEKWCILENHINQDLTTFISQIRQSGIPCYLAMNQEKYRTKYIKEKMFPDVFDKIFSSADMGVKKPNPKYYDLIVEELKAKQVINEPNDLVYFDDQPSNVESAQKLGIRAFLYTNVLEIKKLLQL